MIVFDLVVLAAILFSMFKGYKNGILKEVAGILGFYIGVYVAITAGPSVNNLLGITAVPSKTLTMVVLFVLILLGVNLGVKLGAKFLDLSKIGPLNNTFGASFAGLRTFLMFGFLFSLFLKVNEKAQLLTPEQVEASNVIQPIQSTTMEMVPVVKGLFDTVKKEVGA